VVNQNAVMGEHTCMVGKPLQTDLRVNISDKWGFFGPFYRGESIMK